MTSLCDSCARPGTCCTHLLLSAGALRDGTPEEVDAMLAELVTCTDRDGAGSYMSGRGPEDYARTRADPSHAHARLGLPFRRTRRDQVGRWRYACSQLGEDGRCRNYEERPAVCRQYVAGESPPCCHHVPRIGACSERAVSHVRYVRGVAGTCRN